MLLDFLNVQVNAETGLVAYVYVAIHDFIMMTYQKLFFPFDVEFVKDFLYKVVRCARCDLHTNRRADRSLSIMRGDHPVVRVDHVADVAAGPETPAGEGLGLEDMDDIVLEELSEFILGMQAFTCCNWDR